MSLPICSRFAADPGLTRRGAIAGAAGVVAAIAVRPARAEPADMDKAIADFLKGRPLQDGAQTIRLDIPPLVENGNSVSVAVTVAHPMDEKNHVAKIALFNERNPQSDVAIFHLTPFSGRAEVLTRIRLATSQHVAAIAELSDGRCLGVHREVIVTIAACTEE